MQLKAIGQAYAAVEKFNEVSGQMDNVTHETVNHAISMAFSELTELIEAFEEGDAVHTAKEAADLFVTACGVIQKLEATGIDMQGVLKEVTDNNYSKFIPQGEPLQYDSKFAASFNQRWKVWVVKDSEGKVRKTTSYQNCDVSKYVLKDMFKEAP